MGRSKTLQKASCQVNVQDHHNFTMDTRDLHMTDFTPLGATHPSTATSLNNLAALYQSQGKYTQAELLFRQVLTIRQQTLGPEHPDTAGSHWWLATLAEQQGKDTEAKELYEQAMRIYEKVLGNEHPTTQQIQRMYEALLEKMKKTSEEE